MDNSESTQYPGKQMFKELLDGAETELDDKGYERLEDIKFIILPDEKAEEADFAIMAQEDDEKIRQRVWTQLRSNWWLQDEVWFDGKTEDQNDNIPWRERGTPKEQITITTKSNSIELYNYLNSLNDTAKNELLSSINIFSNICDGYVIDFTKYVLISNNNHFNRFLKGPTNGVAAANWDHALKLYPPALEDKEHRVALESSDSNNSDFHISNFEGTLIHELSHTLGKYIPKDMDKNLLGLWSENFGWISSDTNHYPITFQHSDEYSFITSYAKNEPGEDFAESMVAAIKCPELLDPRKLEFIKKYILVGDWMNNDSTQLDVKTGSDISLPRVKQPVKVYVKPPAAVIDLRPKPEKP